jgi:(DL)-glycerol-3-phosphatase
MCTGVARLVAHLHAHGVPMAVATSSHRHHFNLKTAHHAAVFSCMDAVVTGDDPAVARGKPSPDIFLLAATRFRQPPASPAHVLVFEDAPNGVLAAVAAGMPVVMVPSPLVGEDDRRPATQVLASLVDFDPQAWGLPPYPADADSPAPARVHAP